MTEKIQERFSLNYLHVGITTPILILGLALSVTELLLGLPLIILWLAIATCRKGTEVDYDAKQINFFTRILGIKFNAWERVANYTAYLIRRKVNSVQYTSRIQQQSFHVEKTILALFKNDPHDFKIVKVDSKENLLKLGLLFEERLGLHRHITKR